MDFKEIELLNEKDYKLTSLEIGLTSKCNFNCKYCCKYSLEGDSYISAVNCIKIIEKLDHLKRIKLSGGEAIIYFDECLKLLNYCKENGIETQINTNGSLLNKDKISKLQKAGLNTMHYSLNFFNSTDYSNYYNCSTKIFPKIVENIKNSLSCNNLDTVVETIIFRETENKILETHKFLKALGITKHEVQLGIPVENNNWKCLTDLRKLTEIMKNLIMGKEENEEIYFSCFKKNISASILNEIINFAKDKLNVFFPDCIEGKNQLHVHSNGDVLICELGYPVVIGNIFNGTDLNSINQNPPKELEEFILNHECKKKYYCEGSD